MYCIPSGVSFDKLDVRVMLVGIISLSGFYFSFDFAGSAATLMFEL